MLPVIIYDKEDKSMTQKKLITIVDYLHGKSYICKTFAEAIEVVACNDLAATHSQVFAEDGEVITDITNYISNKGGTNYEI